MRINIQTTYKKLFLYGICQFFFGLVLYAQVRIDIGGVVALGTPNNNQSNYVLIGTNSRYDSTKVSIDGYNHNGLAINTNHTYNFGWSFVQKVDNDYTKCNIVSKNGSHKFYVFGTGYAYGYGFVNLSDRRIKKDLKVIPDPMNKVRSLTGYTFKWDQNFQRPSETKRGVKTDMDTGTFVGLIAQDVQRILPEAVVYDEDSILGINYPVLIPLLVEAIKQQQDVIDTLALKMDSLVKNHNKVLRNIKGSVRDVNQIYGDTLYQIESPTQQVHNSLVLYQNQPNPFSKETMVHIYSSKPIVNGLLLITNLNGELMKTLQVNGQGDLMLTIDARSLKPAIYLYTLVVDGQEVTTRKMILTE